MKLGFVVFLILIYFLPSGFAQNSNNILQKLPTASDRLPVRSLMQQFLASMEKLKPYMISEVDFAEVKNDKVILTELKKLLKLSQNANHEKVFERTNFHFSRDLLQNHLLETQKAFQSGNKEFARWMLNSTANVCLTCHIQLPNDPKYKSAIDWSGFTAQKGATYADAQFAFSVHRYDEALEIFRLLIASYPKSELKANQLENAVRKLVAYWARIKRDPASGAAEMKTVAKNSELPEFLKRDVKAWESSFHSWKMESTPDIKKVSGKELLTFVDAEMAKTKPQGSLMANDPRMVSYLKLSGMLYEYLYLHPKSTVTPKILYWLGVIENRLSNSFFFSLGDLYLKECINSYTKDEYAKKCYQEYSDSLTLSYTGSRGTFLPPDVKKELAQMKKKVGL